MGKSKKDRIALIRDEVNDLHPLLKRIFSKLPGVAKVEYTHGPQEMGADFVLARQDEALGEVAYVGVIAKTSKIHQNITDVVSQIEECSVERLFAGGSKKIFLNQIWVLTTNNITEGAKRKIHQKYQSSGVYFVDGLKISQWIDEFVPEYWHDVPGEIGTYLQAERERQLSRERNVGFLGIEAGDVYIPLDLVPMDAAIYASKKQHRKKTVDILSEIESHKLIMIEGRMGFGKSRLIRETIKALTDAQEYASNRRLPIFANYKELVDTFEGDIMRLASARLANVPADVLDDAEIVFFIDSIDEVEEKTEGEALKKIIRSVQQGAKVRLVLASRPLALLEEDAGIYRALRRLAIEPLSMRKIRRFIEGVCTELDLPKRIMNDLRKSALFKQLPQSPMAAILLSKLIQSNSQDLPSNLTDLFSQSVELMLGRWDIGKDLLSNKDYEATVRCMQDLARYVVENNLEDVSRAEVVSIFNDYVQARNIDSDAEQILSRVLARSGLLFFDSNKQTVFFPHRSFAEFLYAQGARRSQTLPIDQRIYDVYWQDIYFFYVGLEPDCPDLLKEILSVPTLTESDEWMRVFGTGNFLLAGHSAPYKVTADNLHFVFVEAAGLFQRILSGDTATKLETVTPMHALWLIQMLLRQFYSFEFFRPSMESVALELSQYEMDSVTRAYSFFFLGVVCLDLGESEPFSLLFDQLDDREIPLPLRVALECEAEASERAGRSVLVRKHNKRMRKLRRSSKPFGDAVRNLFIKPISALSSSTLLCDKKDAKS